MEFTAEAVEAMLDHAERTDRCPLCGVSGALTVKPADEVFHRRRGCLSCNRWWEKPRVKVR